MNERSDKQYENWLQESIRFDNVVLGIALACVGYLASHWESSPLGMNPNTLELISILAGALAVVAAFKRSEAVLVGISLSHQELSASEAAGALMKATERTGMLINVSTGDIFTAEEAIKRAAEQKRQAAKAGELQRTWAKRAKRFYVVRNYLLAAAMLGVLVTRVWAAYV